MVDNNVNTGKDNKVQEEEITNENNGAQEDKTNLNDTGEDSTINEDTRPELPDPAIDKIYDVVDKKYDNYGLHITYPQITNLGDKDKQEKINKMIKSEALIALSFYGEGEGRIGVKDANWEINYKIKFESKNVFSITFSGLENDKGSHYPIDTLYTLNINMNKCTKLKLSDFVNIDEKFVDNFRKYRISELGHNGVGYRAFNFFINGKLTGSTDYLLKSFQVADSSYKDSPYTFSYITKDYLVISTEIQHNLGDYLEIKLKYEDIKDNIKSDNEIWKGLLK
jgi:hypothetical protein